MKRGPPAAVETKQYCRRTGGVVSDFSISLLANMIYICVIAGGEQDVQALPHPQHSRSRDRHALAWLAHSGVGHGPGRHAECKEACVFSGNGVT